MTSSILFCSLLCLVLSLTVASESDLQLLEDDPRLVDDDDVTFDDGEPEILIPQQQKRFFSGSRPFPVLYRGGRYPIRLMTKRALSIFTRWRGGSAFNGDHPNELSGHDIVSAVSRGGQHVRPLGQPLRWG